MPLRQRRIINPVFIGACCSHVHFRRCLCHVLHHSLAIKSCLCVFDSVQMMDSDLSLRLTDAALRHSGSFFFLLGEKHFDQTFMLCQ